MASLTHIVTRDWKASYSDPIQLAAEEALEFDGQKDVWDGYLWLWAINVDDKEGWVPDCIVSSNVPATAIENYSAKELTCQKGQALTAERRLHGWVFCRDAEGRRGWVPERNLSEID